MSLQLRSLIGQLQHFAVTALKPRNYQNAVFFHLYLNFIINIIYDLL